MGVSVEWSVFVGSDTLLTALNFAFVFLLFWLTGSLVIKLVNYLPADLRRCKSTGRFTSLMDLQEVGCGYVDWIGLAQDRDRWRRLVSVVMNLRVP